MAAKSKSAKSKSAAELSAARAAIKQLKRTVAGLEKSVGKLEKRVAGVKAEARKVVSKRKSAPAAAEVKTEVVPIDEAPAAELTVAQLRAAARAQGIAGYSRMRKQQLIAALAE